ncbi:MAG: class I SAM-dependent methyltransferase [Alphaproteobacteria bacterium]|nr:class I SAM-dependent methyltransferase [Alphaproteobacteria bacterium]
MAPLVLRRPRFIADQARHARNLLDRLIASAMASENWPHSLHAIEALDIADGDHVLDVGCGPGRSLARLAALAPHGRIFGIDPAPPMVEIARKRNRESVDEGRLDVVVASVAHLPFVDARFDKVLCVHGVYFWNDLATAFRELARVLKPGGRLALLFTTSADEAAVRAFPAEVCRFPAPCEVIAPLEAAGFAVTALGPAGDGTPAPPILLVATRR